MAPRKEWGIVAITIVIGAALFAARGPAPAAGDRVRIALSLAPADRTGLACALGDRVEGYACDFQSPALSRGLLPGSRERLVPVVTDRRQVYLLGGVFADAAVTRAIAAALWEHSNERFSVTCSVRLLRRVADYWLRFDSQSTLAQGVPVWAAAVERCAAPSSQYLAP